MIVITPDPAAVMPSDKAFCLSKYGPYAVNVVSEIIPAPVPIVISRKNRKSYYNMAFEFQIIIPWLTCS